MSKITNKGFVAIVLTTMLAFASSAAMAEQIGSGTASTTSTTTSSTSTSTSAWDWLLTQIGG